MDLADLFNETAPVTSKYKNLTFVMQVFTEKLTPAYRAKAITLVSKAQAEAESGAEGEQAEHKDETALMVADLVEGWKDEKGEDVKLRGEIFPPVYENTYQLSYPLLSTLLRDITTFLGAQANPPSATN